MCSRGERLPNGAWQDSDENLRMMQQEEAQAMGMHLDMEMEEEMDWYEPKRESSVRLGD